MQLTKILDGLDISYCRPGEHHHVREGWVGIDCPWCPTPMAGRGRYRLGIEISTGRVNCWVCGHHSLISVLMEVGRVPYKAAKDAISNIEFTRFLPDYSEKASGSLKKPKGIGPLARAHREYLRGRGFDPLKIQKLWKVEGIRISSNLQWRLFIPIFLDGEEISWTTRSLNDNSNGRKYISASPSEEKTHFKDSLYGIDLARNSIIVVEGPTDVWRIGPGAVALYGLNWTASQVNMIAGFHQRAICFDNEDSAQDKAIHLAADLYGCPGKTTIIKLDSEDPGSASEKEIHKLRQAVLD
jgi:hypothetical protein